MIQSAELKNFGPLRDFKVDRFENINLIIGENSSGKSFLLKALYSAIKSIEDFKRGDDIRNISEILSDRLYWTFQTEKIGDIVSKNADKTSPLTFKIFLDGKEFQYSYGRNTQKSIQNIVNKTIPREGNSIFIPAKEVLTLFNVIIQSREKDKIFGFDDTYLDLVRALRIPVTKGNNYPSFSSSRKVLEDLIGGKVKYDGESGKWQFNKDRMKFSVGATAEGIKKIAIFDTLLGNRYLNKSSVIFIDEPESSLHPDAISKYLDIIFTLAQDGIQFFIASHSYFVVKKLYLIAQKNKINLPVIILNKNSDEYELDNLVNGIPDNTIIRESIRLYKEEIDAIL